MNQTAVAQLSREEAIAFHASGKWQQMTVPERGVFQLRQQYLCMPFGVFHEGAEAALGRPIWSHEFADQERLIRELVARTAQVSP